MRFGLPLFYRSCPTVFATRMIGVVGNFQSKNVLVQPCCTKGLALPRCLSHRGGALHLAINANVLETVADIDGVSDNEKTCLRLLRCKLNGRRQVQLDRVVPNRVDLCVRHESHSTSKPERMA